MERQCACVARLKACRASLSRATAQEFELDLRPAALSGIYCGVSEAGAPTE
jgi:hypothetical protein